MKLLTKELEKRFKGLGSQEKVKDPIVVVKFFNPADRGTWFATEYDCKSKVFFGYVSLFNEPGMNEFGEFSLQELEELKLPFGLTIERDTYASEKTLSEWKDLMKIL